MVTLSFSGSKTDGGDLLSEGKDQTAFAISSETVVKNAIANQTSIVMFVGGTLESISDFREVVRASNELPSRDSETRDQLLKTLDAISFHLENLLKLLPPTEMQSAVGEEHELASWTDRYLNSMLPKLQEYVSPEALGKTSVPAGVILLCGGIGSLLTGFSPIGFGAGSVVGKLIVGEIKSGVAADKLQESLSEK